MSNLVFFRQPEALAACNVHVNLFRQALAASSCSPKPEPSVSELLKLELSQSRLSSCRRHLTQYPLLDNSRLLLGKLLIDSSLFKVQDPGSAGGQLRGSGCA